MLNSLTECRPCAGTGRDPAGGTCATCRGAGRFAPVIGPDYYQIQNFLDGSCAVKTSVFSPWQAIRGTGNKHDFTDHGAAGLAGDFAREQNRLARERAAATEPPADSRPAKEGTACSH